MKIILLSAILLCFLNSVWATDYYVSSSTGNDSRTAAQASSASTPWKTITKINSYFVNFKPGDRILFKRGETFYGTLKITKSGTSGLPITIGAYGTGNKPVLTGFATLSNWVSLGSGKYSSYNALMGAEVDMLTINNVVQQIGRYPNSNATNKGYLIYESHGTNSIIDNELTSTTNWTGAEVVVRSSHWTLDRKKVTSHSGKTVSFSTPLTYTLFKNFGYFFQNSLKTLDQFGEWYYNPATKKMSVYFGASIPSNVKASTLDYVVYINNKTNIVLRDIRMEGSNVATLKIQTSTNITVTGCDILSSGYDAVRTSSSTYVKIEKCNIFDSNNNALDLRTSVSNTTIVSNNIKNTGMRAGMGGSANDTYQAITINSGSNHLIEYNNINNTGFTGIRFVGNYVTIKNNLINMFCLVKDDGAGINTFNGAKVVYVQRKLIGNIILNGLGANEGTDRPGYLPAEGIYIDDNVTNVEITGNTVSNCNRGLYIHNASYIKVQSNTLYNNGLQLGLNHDAFGDPIRNALITRNVLFSKTATQYVSSVRSILNDIPTMGKFDSNYYCRPIDDWMVIASTYMNNGVKVESRLDLPGWQQKFSEDPNSKITPTQIVPYKVTSLIGSTKFANGSFATNTTGLYGSSCTVSWSTAGGLDAGAAQVVTSATATKSSISLSVGAVSSAKKYILRFSAKGATNVNIGTYLRLGPSPYTALTPTYLRKISTSRNEYEILFSNPKSSSQTTLIIQAYTQNAKFWLDNIKLYEANATPTDPEDYLHFEYNATNVNKTVTLDGTYTDVKKKIYSGSIVLGPYTSAVLIKTSSVVSSDLSKPVVNITSPQAGTNYTAPAAIRLTATATVSGSSISKVEFFNGSTLITTEKVFPYDWSWTNVLPGTYSITAKATASNGTTTTSSPVSITVKAASSAATLEAFDDKPKGFGTRYDFRLYPNPAINNIQIEFSELHENEKVNVFVRNAAGSTIKNLATSVFGKLLSVDVSSLNYGVYTLSVTGKKGTYSRTFVKK